ncbi:uncharacterized protein LOC106092215 [Stomoxys calcitrans]|uniref:Uncharacterized protein n=1 Tax=Stomoxys calcitrans TaxID=35570 RepID=A0A1I8NT74_STOCA|nr:uncharacterized protein LOC106092215 [Stomoxys calcitrans]
MAIPFYEPVEEQSLHQQPMQAMPSVEVDQVDGHIMTNPPNIQHIETPPSSPLPAPTEGNVMAWKLLAMAMCKALKDHYQQNMGSSATSSSSSFTAAIEILPNGQVKSSWN